MLRRITIAVFLLFTFALSVSPAFTQQTVGCPGVDVFDDGFDYGRQASWEDGVFNLTGSGSDVAAGFHDVLELGEDDFSFTVRFRAEPQNNGTHIIFDMRYEQATIQGIVLFTYGRLYVNNQPTLVLQLPPRLQLM